MPNILNVAVVVGTRPEAIKLLPVIRELRSSEGLHPTVISTGQHEKMVREVLALDGITPDIELGVGYPGMPLNDLFIEVMDRFDKALRKNFGEPPEPGKRKFGADQYPVTVLVHGDTSSAAAAALAAFHLRLSVNHIEAGMRTHSTLSPFPEELNRQLIARIAAFHLAPTTLGKQNLIREGIDSDRILVTGNTGIDAVLWAAEQETEYGDPVLDGLDPHTRVVVVTAHRRENWGEGLIGIGRGVRRAAEDHPDVLFVVPLHPNPVVADTLGPLLAGRPNIHVTSPMDYVPFAKLLKRATLAISDSGGIQEEAPSLGTPVLVTRDTTERTSGLTAGTLRLVGTDEDLIAAETAVLLGDEQARRRMADAPNPYGDGHAARRTVQAFGHLAFNTPPPVPFGHGYRRSAVLGAAGLA
ncbi:non-hydrolyzing UDP-N-acetylglucosamine 2-epimerase [Streptomyces sp. NBC_01465]|uniref:non-hydrolyzing UDP-N-acetylglucosamine 2-epimerase n=1 Tax=Streptomyces sp. NBC_01465 TaxID=2903878 RepID=UPI002E35E53A|nr:UDP-N-acetylglucosamine 2-epimerase (non-hydrolyzing) [Streptomyces sp. NBC_01465]